MDQSSRPLVRRGRRTASALAVCCVVFVAHPAASRPVVGSALARVLPRLGPHELVTVWVDLRDDPSGAPSPAFQVSERARQRRLRRGDPALDAGDRALDPQVMAAVRARVTRVRAVSRWLRCMSVEATAAQVAALAMLAPVTALECLQCGSPSIASLPSEPRVAAPPYGSSAQQLALLRVPELHDRGLTGLGVLIAHFDTGYERFTHKAFRAMRVVAMRDFVDGDGDPTGAHGFGFDQGVHGMITLSALGGFHPGKLIGPAFGASFALARTESEFSEDAREEDYWIAALEWADSLGADIVSSSLKFRENDNGGGYTWLDMDGQTARVTRAAAMAERRGILIVNGAGNDGFDPAHNTLVAPADGVNVLAVGAVTLGGSRARLSSCGPTTDAVPRTKPDVMAPGEDVFAASVESDSAYALVSGTSLSCPLAAGVAALLLSVHDATPAQLRDILRSTATGAHSPDNLWGWGIIDAVAAYNALVALFPTDAQETWDVARTPRFANPFHPRDTIAFAWSGPSPFELCVYDITGRHVRTLGRGAAAGERRIRWDGTGDDGAALPRGVYIVQLHGLNAPPARKLTLLR